MGKTATGRREEVGAEGAPCEEGRAGVGEHAGEGDGEAAVELEEGVAREEGAGCLLW